MSGFSGPHTFYSIHINLLLRNTNTLVALFTVYDCYQRCGNFSMCNGTLGAPFTCGCMSGYESSNVTDGSPFEYNCTKSASGPGGLSSASQVGLNCHVVFAGCDDLVGCDWRGRWGLLLPSGACVGCCIGHASQSHRSSPCPGGPHQDQPHIRRHCLVPRWAQCTPPPHSFGRGFTSCIASSLSKAPLSICITHDDCRCPRRVDGSHNRQLDVTWYSMCSPAPVTCSMSTCTVSYGSAYCNSQGITSAICTGLPSNITGLYAGHQLH